MIKLFNKIADIFKAKKFDNELQQTLMINATKAFNKKCIERYNSNEENNKEYSEYYWKYWNEQENNNFSKRKY